jgi:alpha-tubulin suppressor-like RCC1 family protein
MYQPPTPFELVYPDKTGCTNVLLIEKEMNDPTVFYDSVNDATYPIVYSSTSSKLSLLALLRSKFTSIDRIALAFNSNLGTIKQFLDNKPFFSDESSENVTFIIDVIQEFQVKNIDYLACNTLNYPIWTNYYDTLENATGVVVGASNNYTGNIQYGGDWVMESTGQDIELIYFTKTIEYYKYLLGNQPFFNVVIKQDNTLYGTGVNDEGQLGLGYSMVVNSLTLIPNITNTPVAIACGSLHTIVLMTDGLIYGSGLNNEGQLSNIASSTTSLQLMTPVSGKTPKAISCGNTFTIVLMTDGTIYGTGYNDTGQLGIGNYTTQYTLQPMTPVSGKTPTAISCGSDYTIVLMTDGSLYGTGNNYWAQLGIGNRTNQNTLQPMTPVSGKTPQSISCGLTHTIVLMTDGTIYGTGRMIALGIGMGFGYPTYIETLQSIPIYGKTAKAISCANGGTTVIMTDGTMYRTLYYSDVLELFPNSSDKTPSDFSVGYYNLSVLMTDGTIYSIGPHIFTSPDNDIDSDMNPDLPLSELMPILNTTGNTPSKIYGGNMYKIVLMTNGIVYAMGNIGDYNYPNINVLALGYGYDSIVNNFNNINVSNKTPYYVESGNNYTICLMNDGSIYGTGYNGNGQLGIGNYTRQSSLTLMPNTTGKTPLAISCGYRHTVVLMTDGTIYVTGSNIYGQLGRGNKIRQNTLQPMTPVSGKTPKAISCGNTFTVLLMNDGSIYYTGSLYSTETTLQEMTPVSGKTPQTISCGADFTIILMTDGSIYGTGNNGNGQLGIGNYTGQTTLQEMTPVSGKTPQSISCGSDFTLILMTDGSIYGTGNNGNGQLGIGNYTGQTTLQEMTPVSGKTPKAISCSTVSTIVMMTDGTIYGTGASFYGVLGFSHYTGSGQTTLYLIPDIDNVNKLSSSTISINDISIITYSSNIVCFKEGSLILTDKGYLPIEQLRKGTLVRTLLHGYVPIDMIGKRDIFHSASNDRNKNQLYICTNEAYPEVFEPLVITGCHSILIDEFIDGQRELVNAFSGRIFITDNQYRLPACVDPRAKVYDKPGTYTIYHIALENNDYYTNYGIYANGLLVETCSKRYLKELSNMEII